MSKTISTVRDTRTVAISDTDHRRLKIIAAKYTRSGTLGEGMSLILDFFEQEQEKESAPEAERFPTGVSV